MPPACTYRRSDMPWTGGKVLKNKGLKRYRFVHRRLDFSHISEDCCPYQWMEALVMGASPRHSEYPTLRGRFRQFCPRRCDHFKRWVGCYVRGRFNVLDSSWARPRVSDESRPGTRLGLRGMTRCTFVAFRYASDKRLNIDFKCFCKAKEGRSRRLSACNLQSRYEWPVNASPMRQFLLADLQVATARFYFGCNRSNDQSIWGFAHP